MLKKVGVPILGIVENMSYFADANGNKNYIFGTPKGGQLAKTSGTELLAEIPLDPKISELSDKGIPAGDTIFDNIAAKVAALVYKPGL